MIFIANARGEIQADLAPYAVNQGSDNANQIVFAAPMPENVTVSVIFKLPNGVVTLPYLLANIEQVQGVFDYKGVAYRCWSADIDYPITEIPGSVTAQFVIAYAATGGKPAVRHTTATVFTVNDGITYHPDPPDDPSDWATLIGKIETAISTASLNKDEAERAIKAAEDAKESAERAEESASTAEKKATAAAADAEKAKKEAGLVNEVAEQLDKAKQAAEKTIEAANKVAELRNDINKAKETADEAKETADEATQVLDNFNLENGVGLGSVVHKHGDSKYKQNNASGKRSAAFGAACETTEGASASFAGGHMTKVEKAGGFAWAWQAGGNSSVLNGTYAALFGSGNYAGPPREGEDVDVGESAQGSSSFTEGWMNKNYGNQAHVENANNECRAPSAHVGGSHCLVKKDGEAAFVHGLSLETNTKYQAVFGQYNDESPDASLIVGGGWSDQATNTEGRYNLFEVGKDSTGRYIKLGSKKVYESEFNDTIELEANIETATSVANEAKNLARQAYDGSFAAFNLENGEGKGSVVSKGSVPNTVSADNAFAFGNNNRVEAAGAYAGGSNNTISAEATSSFVHGENLTANRPSQVVFGKSNEQSEYANFIVAVGDENIRRNLFEVGERHGSSYLRLGSQIITAADISRVFTLRQKTKIVDSLVIDFSNGDTVLVGNMQGYINTKSTLGYDYETGMITFSVDEGLATVANNAIDCYNAFINLSIYPSDICIALNPTLVNNVIVEWVASYNEYRAPVFYQCQNTSTASAYSGRLYLDNLIQTYFEVK